MGQRKSTPGGEIVKTNTGDTLCGAQCAIQNRRQAMEPSLDDLTKLEEQLPRAASMNDIITHFTIEERRAMRMEIVKRVETGQIPTIKATTETRGMTYRGFDLDELIIEDTLNRNINLIEQTMRNQLVKMGCPKGAGVMFKLRAKRDVLKRRLDKIANDQDLVTESKAFRK